ncbi:UNVERIFIED_CONTAM: hypothetical protein RMT77_015689 [Armadillidium vulgare]
MKPHNRLKKVKRDSNVDAKSDKSDIKHKTNSSQRGNRLTNASDSIARITTPKTKIENKGTTYDRVEIKNKLLDNLNEKDNVKKDKTNITKKGIIYHIVSSTEVPLQYSNKAVCSSKSSRPVRNIKCNTKYKNESDEEIVRKPKKVKCRKTKIKTEKIVNSNYEREKLIRKKRYVIIIVFLEVYF